MAKLAQVYCCNSCQATFPRWLGQCPSCQNWATISETPITKARNASRAKASNHDLQVIDMASLKDQPLLRDRSTNRMKIGMQELDRILGGGLVPGSVVLVAGDPGIGKSTLMLQMGAGLAKNKKSGGILYVSGEESLPQVHGRAERLGFADSKLLLASSCNGDAVVTKMLENAENGEPPSCIVIDSIQTLSMENETAASGSVAQVRATAQALIQVAKQTDCVVFLVGHVTKDGQMAGPKALEHMVDVVLYFEGERGQGFRLLRSMKNRFGATDDIGVFVMTEKGLEAVVNPSAMFLADHREDTVGTAVFAGIEGTRPYLTEVQALLANCPYGSPRRRAVGWDGNRLNMVLAVLEAHAGVAFENKDVYVNVVGGIKITEPAADLAVALAILSALWQKPVPFNGAAFGELGLSGDIRRCGSMLARMKEISKLGFKTVVGSGIAEADSNVEKALKENGIKHIELRHVTDIAKQFNQHKTKVKFGY